MMLPLVCSQLKGIAATKAISELKASTLERQTMLNSGILNAVYGTHFPTERTVPLYTLGDSDRVLDA